LYNMNISQFFPTKVFERGIRETLCGYYISEHIYYHFKKDKVW
jgi:hypothetical protein